MTRTLMIIAGCPASGKTFQLKKAWREGAPIFGTEHDRLFRECIGRQLGDARAPWFEGRDPLDVCNQRYFFQRELYRDGCSRVLHLDLHRFYRDFLPNLRREDATMFGRSNYVSSSLRESHARGRLVKLVFQKYFHRHFDDFVVNTIFRDYDKCRKSFAMRKHVRAVIGMLRGEARAFRGFAANLLRAPEYLDRYAALSPLAHYELYSFWDDDVRRFLNAKRYLSFVSSNGALLTFPVPPVVASEPIPRLARAESLDLS